MHLAAYEWIRETLLSLPSRRSVLEFGSKNVNGSPRSLVPSADIYFGVDMLDGIGVDLVTDASTYKHHHSFDTVICSEVFEHSDRCQQLCRNAFEHLQSWGVFIVTTASLTRTPHSVDGDDLKENEYYQNLSLPVLRFFLSDFPLALVTVSGEDMYALAIKGR